MRSFIKTIFILLSFVVASYADAQDDTPLVIDEIRQEIKRLSVLVEWDSTFTQLAEKTFVQLENHDSKDSSRIHIYDQLLRHYQLIERSNKSRVKHDFEVMLYEWMPTVAGYYKDEESATDKIIHGFPDSYYPAKILAPQLLTDSALSIMAANYPKEVLYALRYMVSPDALFEAELAAINAPYEAKQYFHYHNSVNSLLKRSRNEYVLKLYEIFYAHRYGSNSFYLLQSIMDGVLTIDGAHEIGKDREKLYNAMVHILRNKTSVGQYSIEERLSELSDKYVRKLMFQRYLSETVLNLDQIEELSAEARTYFLFRSQNMLKKQDLQNLARFFKSIQMETIEGLDVMWLPEEWIVQFDSRLEEEALDLEFRFLIAQSVWDLARVNTPILFITEAEDEIQELDVAIEPLFVFHPYYSSLTDDEKLLIRLENNPYELLSDLSKLTGQLYSRNMLLSLALVHPVEVMAQLDKFQDQPYAAEIIRELALNAPLTAKNYLVKEDHNIHTFLKSFEDEHIKRLYEIDDSLGNWTRAYILLDKIVKGELSLEEADEICKDKTRLLPHLIEQFTADEYLGKYSVEMELEYAALNFIRRFNISENTDHSFREELDKLNAAAIYTFLIFAEQEIIGQSFQKMYDRLMMLTGQDLSVFLKSMKHKYLDRFLRLALHYGMENDMFNRLSASETMELWTVIFNNLENSEGNEVNKAIEAGEIIVGLQGRDHLRQIQDIIREEYDRLVLEHHDEGVAAYGILASIMAQKLHEGWSVYAAPYYEIPDLIAIPVYQLFNEKLVNIQHYYFYDDRDGLYSYRNFLSQYERSDYNWKIEDKGLFIKISSKSGKSVEIYANKPNEGEVGIANLEAYLKSNKLEPRIIVHRGLSTHTLKTFRKVPESAKLILDGSCGGFYIQGVALENAPGAHILCNRNIGTMHINDPMFKQISESIRQGKDIIWPSFWSEMEARLGTNPYFKDYIPPHKNVAALIIKAYYDVLDINN